MSYQKPPKPYYKGNTEFYRFTSFKDAAKFAREEAVKLKRITNVTRKADSWVVTIYCTLKDRIGHDDWLYDGVEDGWDNELDRARGMAALADAYDDEHTD